MKMRHFFLFAAVLILLSPASSIKSANLATAEMSASPLFSILHKIESRRGPWNSLRGELSMRFIQGKDTAASCRGDIYYDRIDEQLMINCYNTQRELLFSFKTEDKSFELYLPGQNSIYQGNIFDLQYAPSIEMHITPLDLYRALKPMMIPEIASKIEKLGPDETILNVFGRKPFSPGLSRQVHASREGDIFREIFFSSAGLPTTWINRSDFRAFGEKDLWKKNQFFYPKKISIANEPGEKTTLLLFDNLEFFFLADDSDWRLDAPENAEIIPIKTVS